MARASEKGVGKMETGPREASRVGADMGRKRGREGGTPRGCCWLNSLSESSPRGASHRGRTQRAPWHQPWHSPEPGCLGGAVAGGEGKARTGWSQAPLTVTVS